MKKIRFIVLSIILVGCVNGVFAQAYVKLNGLYALVGVVNPAVEFAISPKSTIQTELVYSPWKSVNGYHEHFGIMMLEYRRYFKRHNEGWYLAANGGMMAFDMSKPYMDHGLKLEDRYSKGWGMMVGLAGGYEMKIKERWLLDFFFGWAFMSSMYNGYSFDGQIDMDPHRPEKPKFADPYNGSAEWLPNKIGVSIGYKFIKGDKAKK